MYLAASLHIQAHLARAITLELERRAQTKVVLDLVDRALVDEGLVLDQRRVLLRGSWVVGRGSWVVGGGRSSVVGHRRSLIVGRRSLVVGRRSWVVGRGSWVVGRGSWSRVVVVVRGGYGTLF